MVGGQAAQLALDPVDLLLEHVDQVKTRRDARAPRLGQLAALEEALPTDAEEVIDRSAQAVLEKDRVYAVLERGALVHQVEPEARPLPLAPHLRSRQPDLRHQVAAGELGQHPGVDPIGLARERRDPLRPLRIRDPHIPAGELELVVHEPRPGHRLDRRQHRLPMLALEAVHKMREPIAIRRAGALADPLTVSGERVPVETLATEIQSDVQHPWASFRDHPPESLRRAGGPSSSDSLRVKPV